MYQFTAQLSRRPRDPWRPHLATTTTPHCGAGFDIMSVLLLGPLDLLGFVLCAPFGRSGCVTHVTMHEMGGKSKKNSPRKPKKSQRTQTKSPGNPKPFTEISIFFCLEIQKSQIKKVNELHIALHNALLLHSTCVSLRLPKIDHKTSKSHI